MTMRYFEIRAPRADFTGRVGGISFADGVARVSFADERDDKGMSAADELGAQPGRAAVLFAQRRRGYTVVEIGEDGKPLTAKDEKPARPSNRTGIRRDGLPTGAPKADADEATWRAYVAEQGRTGGVPEGFDQMSRDQLVAYVKEQAK